MSVFRAIFTFRVNTSILCPLLCIFLISIDSIAESETSNGQQVDDSQTEAKDYLYFPSHLLNYRVGLTPLSISLHSLHVAGFEVAKFYAYMHLMGLNWAIATYAATDAILLAQPLFTRPWPELALRDRIRSFQALQQFKKLDGITSVSFLSGKKTSWKWHLIPYAQETTGLAILKLAKPLSDSGETAQKQGWKDRWGKAISIEDVHNAEIEMKLSDGDQDATTVWRSTLGKLLEGTRIDDASSEDWRRQIKAWRNEKLEGKGLFRRFVDYLTSASKKNLSIKVKISHNGTDVPLGALYEGSQVPWLLGTDPRDSILRGTLNLFRSKQEKKGHKSKIIPMTTIQITKVDSWGQISCGDLFSGILGKRYFVKTAREVQ